MCIVYTVRRKIGRTNLEIIIFAFVYAEKFKIESKGNPLWVESGSQSFFTILLLYRKFYRSYF